MLLLPNRHGMETFLEIFGQQMQSMGIQFDWRVDDGNVIINVDTDISNLLRPALGYCFEDAYRFDHKGVATIVGTVSRPPIADDHTILHMYKRWQRKMQSL